MNLIEQLGYEKVKEAVHRFLNLQLNEGNPDDVLLLDYVINNRVKPEDILLDHRRQHNIYEAGDLVVMVDEDDYDTIFRVIGKPQRLYHLQGNDDLFYGRLDFQIRHATDEEIKSGDRIKQGAKS